MAHEKQVLITSRTEERVGTDRLVGRTIAQVELCGSDIGIRFTDGAFIWLAADSWGVFEDPLGDYNPTLDELGQLGVVISAEEIEEIERKEKERVRKLMEEIDLQHLHEAEQTVARLREKYKEA